MKSICCFATITLVVFTATTLANEDDGHHHEKTQRELEHEAAHEDCHLQFVVVSEWQNELEDGYAATVTVTSPGAAAGELQWTFQGSEAVLRTWDAEFKQEGELFTATKADLKSHAGSDEFSFAIQIALDQGELEGRIEAAKEAGLSPHAALSPIDVTMGPRACMITPFRMNLDMGGKLSNGNTHPEGPAFNPANKKAYDKLRLKAIKHSPKETDQVMEWTKTIRDNAIAVVGSLVSIVAIISTIRAVRSESTAAKARALMSETRYRIARLSVSSANAPLRWRADSLGLSKKNDDDGTFLPLTATPGDSHTLPTSMSHYNGPSAHTTRARTPSMSFAPPTYSA